VVLAFSRRFWLADFFDVVCTDCFIPEFWATTYPGASRDAPAGPREREHARPASGCGDEGQADGDGGSGAPGGPPAACSAREESQSESSGGDASASGGGASASGGGQAPHCLVGFAAGRRAEAMSGMSESSIVLRALGQLDQIFGARRPPAPLRAPALSLALVPRADARARAGTPSARRPATGAFLRAHVADWARAPYIGGAYSYPTLHARRGDREALAAPVGGALFFAGEATHAAVNPCLQAALETGARAAAQAAAALRRPRAGL